LATLGVDTHQIQYDLILVIKKATKLLMLKVRKVVVELFRWHYRTAAAGPPYNVNNRQFVTASTW